MKIEIVIHFNNEARIDYEIEVDTQNKSCRTAWLLPYCLSLTQVQFSRQPFMIVIPWVTVYYQWLSTTTTINPESCYRFLFGTWLGIQIECHLNHWRIRKIFEASMECIVWTCIWLAIKTLLMMFHFIP